MVKGGADACTTGKTNRPATTTAPPNDAPAPTAPKARRSCRAGDGGGAS